MIMTVSYYNTENSFDIEYNIIIIMCTILSDITMGIQTDLEDIIDVNETTTSVRACVNITSGSIESASVYIYYFIGSGSASGTHRESVVDSNPAKHGL